MKALRVGQKERADINSQVDKVLRGLGNPEPPLRLEDVRELLRLDLQYYSSTNDSVLREFVSKIKVGAKQLFMRPTLLLDVVKKADLSALWVPDRSRILIDSGLPEKKQRWAETHEVAHSITEWHKLYLFGDSSEELSLSCHAVLEAEANYGAGQLLFFRDRFAIEARDVTRSLESIKDLSIRYGNTMTSTLWRYVEQLGATVPMLALVTAHPRRIPADHDPEAPCKHFIPSPAFRGEFSSVTECQAFNALSYCKNARGGCLGREEVLLRDDNGTDHVFQFETFFNRYEALTLAFHVREHRLIVPAVSF